MRKITVLLVLCLCICFNSASGFAEDDQVHYQKNDYEYVINNDWIEIVAYHGSYLPRDLSVQLGDYCIELDYDNPIFGSLIHDLGIYQYGQVAKDEVFIVGYTGYEQIACIPEEINGIPVTGIGDKAFQYSGCLRDRFAEVVVIPGSIRSIGRQAFSCAEIGYIILQDGLEEIGDLAFEGHSQSKFFVPDSVWKMGVNPFVDHLDLGYVNGFLFPIINNQYFGAVYDTGNMLYSKEDMRVITYRSNLEAQWNLSTVCTVPDGIRIIGMRAFWGDPYLTEVILPESLEVIEPEAFFYCQELRSVSISEGVTTIGDYAFGQTAITELEIPSSVTSIGEFIFHDWAPEEATILCDPGSTAEEYAISNGYQVRYR